MSKCVLLADDSRLARLMLRAAMSKSRPDWEIIEAANGDEALEKSGGRSIDLFLVDLNMPGMNGLELGAQLSQRQPDAPIALVTANIQDKMRDRAESMGFLFLDKPVTDEKITTLLARLNLS